MALSDTGRKKKATLKDVATLSGVSIRTASNVLNNRSEHYSQSTYTKVMEAVMTLKYLPNINARHLRMGKTGIIALVIPEIRNPYFTEIAQEIISVANSNNSTVLIDFTHGDREKEYEIIGGLRPLTVDGIIMDVISLDINDLKSMSDTPLVLLGERLIKSPFDHVFIDNVAAAELATQHLISLGKKRIAPIGFMGGNSHGMPFYRMKGFSNAMEKAKISIFPQYLISPKNLSKVFDRDHGEIIMQELLSLDPIPDAIFCFNDLIALGAMKTIRSFGLNIPEDIAVIGFDDITEGQYSVPSLSTISPDKKSIAEKAIFLLNEQIESNRKDPKIVSPSFKLIERESTLGKSIR